MHAFWLESNNDGAGMLADLVALEEARAMGSVWLETESDLTLCTLLRGW